MIETGSDFSGVGAFDQALIRLGIEYKTIFACDMDKYARQTYCKNYGTEEDYQKTLKPFAKEGVHAKPKSFSFYYPYDVYDREIPKKPLSVYVTSPPCQSFSTNGKRGGEDDERGLLFYNSHGFIKKNNPRYFIFENVKGLLSDDKKNPKDEIGRTFRKWLDYLGGKSVNGNPVLFPHPEAADYHIYYKVLNSKNYGVPQNRSRVFIIGIRDDVDNNFIFPKKMHLTKKLVDCLELNVDEKYTLSDKMYNAVMTPASEKWQSGKMEIDLEIARPIVATCYKMHRADTDNYISVISATKSGFELAKKGDSINLSQPGSETRRGRVGDEIAQTLDTACNQAVVLSVGNKKIRRLTPRECFNIMDFPQDFKIPCSDTQTYKQAGNSIPVAFLVEILKKLNLKTI